MFYKGTNDLLRGVDAICLREHRARHIDLGEAAAGVEEAVVTRGKRIGVCVLADDERGCGDDDNS